MDPEDPDDSDSAPASGRPARPRRPQQVFTLLVEAGRAPGDGLPDGCTGAALMLYATGVDEAEAVREAVAVLKQADVSVLNVEGLGTAEEREAAGDPVGADERELMARALADNAVVVVQVDPFFD